ncbi:protein-methionine-sulfoxide reductase heme-binding subunit MsrQ [Stutzerimonas tarimensis]|uniref:Protein-methionine-sulfoxide reductase heme-binding subunit MsrQ n=1 Tax=Stutzerimonas tarimensis TaxID=1507735 RepID=A0ABV7T451_9GAMM
MAQRGWRLLVFIGTLSLPCYWLFEAAVGRLGPDPGKVLVDNLGNGSLVLLLLTLAMSPLNRLARWGGWMAVRRQLGLWSFTYASLHLAGYFIFMLGLELSRLIEETRERPYILVGLLAYLGLLALAFTSTRASMRRLGKRWKRIHQLIYPILSLALLHMLWVVRADAAAWALYAAAGALLIAMRIPGLTKWMNLSWKKSRNNR